MEVPYDEGVAVHIDPESCAVVREGHGEALTGEHTGQPLSRERKIVPGADAVRTAEGNMDGRAYPRAPGRPGVVADPGMCVHSLCGNREISRLTNSAGCACCSGPHREGEEP